MAALNPLTRELVFKIVFYGPGLGGKTTTLQHVHATANPEHRGNMVSLATDTDRTLYFDFLPLKVLELRNLSVRLQLFTVPGQVYYGATRKLVLTGADGIVFVADSQAARFDANQESLDDLNANLADHGRALSRIPHSFHWNKRDLPDIVPVGDLDRRLNLFSAPSVETVATVGTGVFAGLELITRAVFNAYRAELPKSPPLGERGKRESLPVFLDAEEVGLADAIRELADSQRAASPPPPPIPEPAPSGTRALEGAMGPTAASESKMRIAPAAMTVHAPAPETPTLAPASSQFSLAEAWPESEREAVQRAETLLAARDAASAVVACEALVTRMLAEASLMLGATDQPREPAVLAMLLGASGPRYLALRASARAARQQKDVAVRDAVEAYLFALDMRRALDRITR